MRFIVTSDWHIHPWRECSRDGGRDRLADGLSAARQILQAARSRECPVIFLGDMKHVKDRWLLSVLNGLLDLFAEYADVPKVLLHGNHDGVAGGKSGLEAFREMPGVQVVTEPVIWSVAYGTEVFGVQAPAAWWPYQPALDGLPAFLEEAREARAQVLFGHAFLKGAALGSDEVRLDKGIPLEAFGLAGKNRIFQQAYFGDAHKRQVLGAPDGSVTQVAYPGSPYAQNWGEREEERSCLYVDTGLPVLRQYEAIPIRGPRFIIVDWVNWPGPANAGKRKTAAQANELMEEWIEIKADDWVGHFVRILLPPGSDLKLAELLREASGARSFQVIVQKESRVEQRANVHAGMSTERLLAEYVAARPPQDGLDPTAVLDVGKKLAAEG